MTSDAGSPQTGEPLITGQSIIVAVKDQIFSELDDEIVILNLQQGMYYGLNAVGSRVWKLIQEPQTVDAIRDTLLQEYDVAPEICEYDLFELLHDLADKRLIEVQDAPAA
ncbi:MAG: PqqD family protein [Chloroflexi bacterium]|jgi:hypothetical protein|nr:PqqD family protein [Chloroflexota bacterium]